MTDLVAELEKVEKQSKVHRIKISDLKADLIGCQVEANVQVVGEATQKALPKTVNLTCKTCGYTETISFSELNEDEKTVFLGAVVFGKKEGLTGLAKDQKCEKGLHRFTVRPVDYMDFNVVFVRDLLDPLLKFDSRVYQTRKTYLINQTIPYAKKITIYGRVYLEHSTKNITIIADKAEPYQDEVRNFEVTEEDKVAWKQYFTDKEPKEILSQVAPGMVGRSRAQESLLLGLHSVSVIPDVYAQPIRGSLRILFFGDTKTYKSRSGKDLTIDHYGFGDYVIGESSSRTGITYTIDSDNKALIWGALPLNDLGFFVLDGLQSIHKEEWRETREALESQRVIVRRSLSGEALARDRILAIINPGTRTQRPMNSYLFKCQALMDTYVFSDPADVTRWDLFVPFSSEDVQKGEIAKAKPTERPVPDQVFVRHVFWVWSRRPEHVVYTQDAVREIEKQAEVFMNDFATDSVPIVHLGYREVISRVSVAYAALMHSTDQEHVKIVVKKTHVDHAVKFLKEVAESLDLEVFKLEEEGKRVILPSEREGIIADLDETSLKILDLVKIHPRNSGELAEQLDVTTKTVKRKYAVLRKHELIKTTPGQGVSLTARGVNFLRQYLGDKGTESVPS